MKAIRLLLTLFALSSFTVISPKAQAQKPGAPAAEGPAVNYVYNAKVSRVLSGDLVALDVDLGFGVWLHNQSFKLQGVPAAPSMEADKAAALAAKTNAQAVLKPGAEVVLQSVKDKTDKSAVYHAVLWLNGENLNTEIAKAAK